MLKADYIYQSLDKIRFHIYVCVHVCMCYNSFRVFARVFVQYLKIGKFYLKSPKAKVESEFSVQIGNAFNLKAPQGSLICVWGVAACTDVRM